MLVQVVGESLGESMGLIPPVAFLVYKALSHKMWFYPHSSATKYREYYPISLMGKLRLQEVDGVCGSGSNSQQVVEPAAAGSDLGHCSLLQVMQGPLRLSFQ